MNLTSVGKVLTSFFKLWPIIKWFFPTTLSLSGTDREWLDGMLIHKYRFRVSKPRYSRSASKAPISLNIPKEISVAEFRLDMPDVQTKPAIIPASSLNLVTYDLIGPYLENVHEGEEITVNLWMPYSSKEIVKKEVSQEANCKLYKVRNPNDFPVKSCEIEWPLLLSEIISEINLLIYDNS